jgi:outer membrane receptor protein involved in Fe transport
MDSAYPMSKARRARFRLGFDVLANCAFTDAKFTESIPAIGITRGEPLVFVPRLTTTLSSSYSREIAQGWRFQIASDLQHQSRRLDIARTPLPAHSMWNARVALSNDRFRITLYVRNITNKQALLGSEGSVGKPDAQHRMQAALKRGLQTRDAELALARMLGSLSDC